VLSARCGHVSGAFTGRAEVVRVEINSPYDFANLCRAQIACQGACHFIAAGSVRGTSTWMITNAAMYENPHIPNTIE